jgi:hypothetical protein
LSALNLGSIAEVGETGNTPFRFKQKVFDKYLFFKWFDRTILYLPLHSLMPKHIVRHSLIVCCSYVRIRKSLDGLPFDFKNIFLSREYGQNPSRLPFDLHCLRKSSECIFLFRAGKVATTFNLLPSSLLVIQCIRKE